VRYTYHAKYWGNVMEEGQRGVRAEDDEHEEEPTKS